MNQPNSLAVKATLLCVSTLTVMAGATIAPSLPSMEQHFSSVPNAAYWVKLILTVPALTIAIGAPFVGILIDRFGRKPILTIALLVYGVAGSSGLWLNTIESILVGRAFLGISVAGVMVTATALIADYYTGTVRGQFLGLQAAFMALGGVIFLTLGGFLAELNWRMPFAIYLFALVLVACVLFVLPEPKSTRNTSDAMSNDKANANATETSSEFPIQFVILTYGIAIVTQIVFYLIPTQLPFHLKALVNANASRSGMAIALTTLFSAISSLQYQKVKSRLTFISVYGMAFASMAVGYSLIFLAQDWLLVLPGLAIAGVGLGLLMPNMNFCLTSIAPSFLRGRVLGGLTTSFFLGQFLSPLVSQPLSLTVGLQTTYGLAGVVMIVLTIGALISLFTQK
jgi:MFS family permease